MAPGIDKGLALQAMLAEYETLREEIQNRSELQNRFLQMHLTAITVVVGLLLQNELQIHDGFIVLIAVSSTVFGRWWIDQALTINRIGRHLADPVEQDINALVGTSALRWESEDRNPILRKFSEALMFKGFEGLVLLTFLLPAITASIFALVAVFFDIRARWEPHYGLDRADVWVVFALLLFVVVIFFRMMSSRRMMIELDEYSDCYKRQLRGEMLDDECQQKIDSLKGQAEWVSNQARIRRVLRE